MQFPSTLGARAAAIAGVGVVSAADSHINGTAAQRENEAILRDFPSKLSQETLEKMDKDCTPSTAEKAFWYRAEGIAYGVAGFASGIALSERL